VNATTKPHWSRKLIRLCACDSAVQWAMTQPSLATAWKQCERGDWMLWLAGRLSGPPESASRKKLVLAACACARLSLPHVPAGEERPRIAIETAERWARGVKGVTLDQVRSVAGAVYDASAYYDAADARWSATAAATAAAAAASAVDPAAAFSASAYAATLKICADLVRKHYPQPPRMEKPK
jgi:hypothetical protein